MNTLWSTLSLRIVVNLRSFIPALLTAHATQSHKLCLCVYTMLMCGWQIYSCCFLYCSSEWLCYTDAEREGRLVPIIVGAIIGFLMMVIFFAYLAAFCKRKCAERRAKNAYVSLGSEMWQLRVLFGHCCCMLCSWHCFCFCYVIAILCGVLSVMDKASPHH